MEYVVANPEQKWEGFRPTAYTLNRKVWELPIIEVRCASDGTRQEIPTTIIDVYARFENSPIVSIDYVRGPDGGRQIKTDAETLEVRGLPFHEELLAALLDLKQHGDPFSAEWFWYDSDHPTEDLEYSYTFFVVCKDTIVRESISFFDRTGSGFDPSVFDAADESPPLWKSHPSWHKAIVRYWYRKFYQETRTGQLMVLRPDGPELHCYPEGRWNIGGFARTRMAKELNLSPLESVGEQLQWQLHKIQYLLWAIILLLGMSLVRRC
jgi:hypothetical protein